MIVKELNTWHMCKKLFENPESLKSVEQDDRRLHNWNDDEFIKHMCTNLVSFNILNRSFMSAFTQLAPRWMFLSSYNQTLPLGNLEVSNSYRTNLLNVCLSSYPALLHLTSAKVVQFLTPRGAPWQGLSNEYAHPHRKQLPTQQHLLESRARTGISQSCSGWLFPELRSSATDSGCCRGWSRGGGGLWSKEPSKRWGGRCGMI